MREERVLAATLDHIRDLENHLKNRKYDFECLNNEEEQFIEMKDEEIMNLVQEKENFKKKVEVKKDKIVHDIEDIDAKIKFLVEKFKGLNHVTDVESVVTAEEDRDDGRERPQGLRTVV
eukprot:TRINITY_DN21083_c0_g1_i1.p1 TRINITY_DN21083_c0_g1~~TRINITY_DN21083_c0_g1_i1.p1  ORF type:complete len:119 (+),score=46.03 TRINITY_DN21083_c0_g1_i1:107-463(+)